jgi:hypothetical protein
LQSMNELIGAWSERNAEINFHLFSVFPWKMV